jgi:putative ABC transport system permease protein
LPGINGVAAVIPVVIGFADWRRQSDGRVKPVFVIGSDLNAGALVPWNLVDGNLDALRATNAVAVDRTYFGDLGVSGLGSTAEIRSQPAKVAAVTEGIRSFTTTPYVFADLGAPVPMSVCRRPSSIIS